MTVTISDRTALEELFFYDVLVTCPSDFNLTFKVPNWGLQPDKTFEILFKDSEKYYRVYLTHFLFEKDVETLLLQSSEARTGGSSIGPYAALVCCVALLSGLIIILYVILGWTRKKLEVTTPRESKGCCTGFKDRTTGQGAFIFLYIVWRIFYSFLFTFTIMLSILSMCMQSHVVTLSKFEAIQERQLGTSETYGKEMELYAEREVQRHLEVIHEMQEACAYYMQELMGVVGEHIQNVTVDSRPRRTITHILDHHLRSSMDSYMKKVKTFTAHYQQEFQSATLPTLHIFNKFLDRIYHNDWLLFPWDAV